MLIVANVLGCFQLAVFVIPLVLTVHWLNPMFIPSIAFCLSLLLIYWDLKVREEAGVSQMAKAESGGVFMLQSYIVYSVTAVLSSFALFAEIVSFFK